MSPGPRFPFFLLTRKSWFSLHPRTSLNPRVPYYVRNNRHDILLIILAFIDNTKYTALCKFNWFGLHLIKIVID